MLESRLTSMSGLSVLSGLLVLIDEDAFGASSKSVNTLAAAIQRLALAIFDEGYNRTKNFF